MVLFAENHGYWQKIVDPFSGSQKGKYFIHLCPLPPLVLDMDNMIVITIILIINCLTLYLPACLTSGK